MALLPVQALLDMMAWTAACTNASAFCLREASFASSTALP